MVMDKDLNNTFTFVAVFYGGGGVFFLEFLWCVYVNKISNHSKQ